MGTHVALSRLLSPFVKVVQFGLELEQAATLTNDT